METSSKTLDSKIENQAIAHQFKHWVQGRNNENNRRGGIIMNQADLLRSIESNSWEIDSDMADSVFKSSDGKKSEDIVTDSDSESESDQ